SIAVDKTHVYGTPFFIQADLPIDSARPNTKFRRLMVGQDTGSAITGPARADFYWGAGDEAGKVAGRLRNPGRFVMLLPRELDIVEAGKKMPLPLPSRPPRSPPLVPPRARPTTTSPTPRRSRCPRRRRRHSEANPSPGHERGRETAGPVRGRPRALAEHHAIDRAAQTQACAAAQPPYPGQDAQDRAPRSRRG